MTLLTIPRRAFQWELITFLEAERKKRRSPEAIAAWRAKHEELKAKQAAKDAGVDWECR